MAENKETNITLENIKALEEMLNQKTIHELLSKIHVLKRNSTEKVGSLRNWIRECAEREIKEVAEPILEEEKVEETTDTVEEVVVEPIKEENKEDKKEETTKVVSTEEPAPVKKERKVYIPDAREQNLRNAKNNRSRDSKPNIQNGARPQKDVQGQYNKEGKERQSSQARVDYSNAPVFPPILDRQTRGTKKRNNEKPFEEKKTINKRSLIKEVNVEDFDDDKKVYRKARTAKKQKNEEESQGIVIKKAVITSEIIPLKVLSEKIGIPAVQITKMLFKEGIMKTINDSVDYDTAGFIAAELGIELELKLEKTAEDVLTENFDDKNDDDGLKVVRPPVVAVMGHVDHGKTSLLDRIRKSNVTEGEAGGITQHIGAYQVVINGKTITFLDTPGHAAFTAMRARGAQATDIAIIVIAADDGIMPQTIEAINHAKAAGVSVIVAANKIDKPEANIDRVKTQLTEQGLVPEEWGGDIIVCPVSAKAGIGINELLESINIIAEMRELKANPNRRAKGVVIEAKLDKNKGPLATILVQEGTLKVADSIVVGTVVGKIRAMTDDKGRKLNQAGPSTPVSIMGLDDVPNAGDMLYAVDEKLVKQVAQERKEKEKLDRMNASQKVTLDDIFNKIETESMKVLNLIVKADVQGSAEALKSSLEKIEGEVRVKVIHSATGAITETDIMLAESSNAIIIGFNVRPDSNAKKVMERSGVQVNLYRVIYEAIEDVEKAMKGMLAPKYQETYMGKAEVRETFKITGVGIVAGSYVTEGKIVRNSKLRIYRNDVMICEGDVAQLKRFKDDVKEVAQGFECGISIEKFNEIQVGDFIECYVIEEVKG